MGNIIDRNINKIKEMSILDDLKIKEEKTIKINRLIKYCSDICKEKHVNISDKEIKEIIEYSYEENKINYNKLYNKGIKIGINEYKSINYNISK